MSAADVLPRWEAACEMLAEGSIKPGDPGQLTALQRRVAEAFRHVCVLDEADYPAEVRGAVKGLTATMTAVNPSGREGAIAATAATLSVADANAVKMTMINVLNELHRLAQLGK
jgi:hypothetical protein